jgi:hypothetical protein
MQKSFCFMHGFGSGDCCAEGVRVLVCCLSGNGTLPDVDKDRWTLI